MRALRRERRRAGHEPVTCPTCGGAGRLQQVSRSVFGEFVRTQPCRRCGGTGRIVEHAVQRRARAQAACSRSGRSTVEIPAGIHDGQRIRLSGEGHAGALGGRAGDVYVLVHVRPDERFVREGDDI